MKKRIVALTIMGTLGTAALAGPVMAEEAPELKGEVYVFIAARYPEKQWNSRLLC